MLGVLGIQALGVWVGGAFGLGVWRVAARCFAEWRYGAPRVWGFGALARGYAGVA